jgi:hypothetical protein
MVKIADTDSSFVTGMVNFFLFMEALHNCNRNTLPWIPAALGNNQHPANIKYAGSRDFPVLTH